LLPQQHPEEVSFLTGFIGWPQHSGGLQHRAERSTVLPHEAHSYTTFSLLCVWHILVTS
jgi:hypothetical protein